MAERKRPKGRKKYVTESEKEAKRRDDEGLGTGPVGESREDSASEEDKGLVDGLMGLLGDGTTPPSGNQQSNSSLGGSLLNGLMGGSGNSSSNQSNQQSSLGGSLLNGLLGGGSSSNNNTSSNNSQQNFIPLGGSSSNSSQSSGGGFKIKKWLIILVIIMLLGGGGGLSGIFNSLFGGLLGGGSGSTNFGISQDALQTITQSTTDTSTNWTQQTTTQDADETVATGSRGKYTTILGNGKDVVTIMIYMCGTDLESRSAMATRDLIEMTQASLSDNVNIIVYTGGCKKWQNQNISAKTNQIYKVVKGGLQPLEDNMGNKVMTDPATLAEFIQYCGKNFPANRNELILWDHGGGSVQGYGYDEKSTRSGSMPLAGIKEALDKGGLKFDFIGFDACLMATVETGLMLDDYADYMVASEETEPGIGWYYTDWLTALCNDPSRATVDIGKDIVDTFVDTCKTTCRGQSATLSIVDLAELSNTAPASLKSFSKSLSTMIKNKEYTTISTARNGTREFAQSTGIDQIDLVHFAKNMGTKEGTKLADALQGAVKYNRTTSDMTNSYGLSIYFPYRSASNVDAAVSNYNAIGMDSSYSDAIREFASLEVCGQAGLGGYNSSFGSLLSGLGGGSSTSSGSSDMIGSLLSGFLGGDFGSIPGLSGRNTAFLEQRSLSDDEIVEYIQATYFDDANLKWTQNDNGDIVMKLPEEQWELVEGLDVGMFYDDGEGYMDLGLDNLFEFDDDGNLLAQTDFTWVAVNGQPVAYYHDYTTGEGGDAIITGHIPALLNGERVELLTLIDGSTGKGEVVGARTVYEDEETETVAKNMDALEDGDTLDFICDYYTYDGDYIDSYFIGDTMTVDGDLEISNVRMGDGNVRLTYCFTDIYQQKHWTPAVDVEQQSTETAAASEIEEADNGEEASVVESEEYTTPDDVASYIHTFGHLPSNYITKNEARELGWDSYQGNLWDVAPGKSIGGDRYGNYEGLLPSGTRYTECDVNYEGGYRGEERLIFGKDGSIYYTDDHYQTFTKLY